MFGDSKRTTCLAQELLVDADPSKYQFVNQGTIKIESMDDREEFQLTETAFDTLGKTHDLSIMHIGCPLNK